MTDSKSYSKKEISKILTKASEIQVKKDLFEDQETLSKEDLVHIAEEVGISEEALNEALAKVGEPDLEEQTYSLINGTSRIQDVSSVQGEINEDQWEDLVLEIRKITGGIGKVKKTGNTYEWEQRRSDFGYKHFSFTPKNGQTKIQMVSSWGPLKSLASFLSFFIAFIVTLIAVKEISGKQLALMIAPLFGLGGFAMSRFFLKSYYQKQKDQLSKLTASVSRKISSLSKSSGSIEIEDQDLYQAEEKMAPSQSKESTS